MKKINLKTIFSILITIQIFITFGFTLLLNSINFFPLSFIIILFLIAGILLILSVIIYRTNKKGLKVFSIIFSLLVTIMLSFGSYMLLKSNTLLSQISNISGRTTTLSVVVLKENDANKLADLNGSLMYASPSKKLVDENKAHYLANDNINLEMEPQYLELAKKLIDDNFNAIIMDEAQRGFIEENITNFKDKTKVIDELIVKLPKTNNAKDVDITKQPVNIYISGIDAYGDPSVASRTDSNMILTFNPTTNKMLLTSIPRDYYVPLSCANGAYDKLTHSGIYGVDCSIGTLENLLDIDINYYVRINFTGFMSIIDALGTIDVESPQAFTTHGGKYSFVAGNNTLNSEQALAFARERYNLPGGDNDRVLNQQRVVNAIIKKLASPAILQNFSGLLETVGSNVVTNMPSDKISAFVKMQLNNGGKLEIQNNALIGTGAKSTTTYSMPGWNLYVMKPNEQSVADAIKKIQEIMK